MICHLPHFSFSSVRMYAGGSSCLVPGCIDMPRIIRIHKHQSSCTRTVCVIEVLYFLVVFPSFVFLPISGLRWHVPGMLFIRTGIYQVVFTSWASQVTAREVDWPCPAQFYVFGCKFWTLCWSCTNQQTESRPFYFVLFFSVRYERNNDSKKCKSDHILS